jgi:chemotaxis protein MotA
MAAETPVKPAPAKPKTRPDLATLGGLVVAVGGMIGGLILEGGKVQDVAQVTAAIIVLAGTLGAVMVTTPLDVLLRAAARFKDLILVASVSPEFVMDQIIEFAGKARKQGIVSLEQDADAVQDPFLRKALSLAVDGTDLEQLKNMMELEIAQQEHEGEAEAKVYEAAGGYAPTIGIIGAVMGLIQVMKHLDDIDEVGKGIAVAFVATVYGVGSANLVFLPAGNKLKARLQQKVRMREMMLEGVCGIVEGLNPKVIRMKLEGFAGSAGSAKAKKAKPSSQPQEART